MLERLTSGTSKDQFGNVTFLTWAGRVEGQRGTIAAGDGHRQPFPLMAWNVHTVRVSTQAIPCDLLEETNIWRYQGS